MKQFTPEFPQRVKSSSARFVMVGIILALLVLFEVWSMIPMLGPIKPASAQEASPTTTFTPASTISVTDPVTEKPTLAATEGLTQTATLTPTPTVSPTPTQKASPTPTPRATSTSTPKANPSPTRASAPSATTSPTLTLSATPIPPTDTVTPTPTPSAASIPTDTATVEPVAVLPSSSMSPTETPTSSPGGEADNRPNSGILRAVGVGILAVLIITTTLVVWRRWRPRTSDVPSATIQLQGSKGGANGDLVEPVVPSLPLTPLGPGIPYLQSQNRPAGMICYPLTKPVTRVGRGSNNDLVIDDSFVGWQTVSRDHATIEYDGSRAVVVDCGGPNGIKVNGQHTGVNVLRDGWTVSFGQVEFMFRENRGGGAL